MPRGGNWNGTAGTDWCIGGDKNQNTTADLQSLKFITMSFE